MGIKNYFKERKVKKAQAEYHQVMAQHIVTSRSLGVSDKELVKQFVFKKIPKQAIIKAFELAMKGGEKMTRKNPKDFEEEQDDVEEDEEEEDDEEDDDDQDEDLEDEEDDDEEDDEEDAPTTKKQQKPMPSKPQPAKQQDKKELKQDKKDKELSNLGTVRTLTQQQIVGFEVLTGHDESGEEVWTSCEKPFEAMMLSKMYSG